MQRLQSDRGGFPKGRSRPACPRAVRTDGESQTPAVTEMRTWGVGHTLKTKFKLRLFPHMAGMPVSGGAPRTARPVRETELFGVPLIGPLDRHDSRRRKVIGLYCQRRYAQRTGGSVQG